MSDLQEYLQIATEDGYSVIDEDGVTVALAATHDEEGKRFLVVIEDDDEELYFVQPYDYDACEYDEPVFESKSYGACIDYINK